jgi:hypothetical protein
MPQHRSVKYLGGFCEYAFRICEHGQETIMRTGIAIGFVLVTILILAVSRIFNPYLMVLLLLPIFSLVGMYRAFTSSARKTKRDARSLEKTFITVLLRDAVVIDSAVWQDENRESFFKALAIILAAAGKKVVLYDCQYRELNNAAKAEIEQFQAQGIMTLAPVDISPAAAGEDAAPPAIQALNSAAHASRNVVLVSDKRELIAQARTAMKKRKTGLTVIDNLDDLEASCRNYCAAVDRQKIIPLAGYRYHKASGTVLP